MCGLQLTVQQAQDEMLIISPSSFFIQAYFCPHPILSLVPELPHGTSVGLKNMGNTCYLSTFLQALGHTIPFSNICHQGFHTRSCQSSEEECLLCLAEEFVCNLLAERLHRCLRPSQLYSQVREEHISCMMIFPKGPLQGDTPRECTGITRVRDWALQL